jgi:hypothetical protein
MRKLLSFILIIATSALFYNNVSNWHFHMLPNGMIIEHAHPYRPASLPGSPFEKHTHSDLEFLIFDLIYYSGSILVFLFAGIILLVQPVRIYRFNRPLLHTGSLYPTLPFLRAPPVPVLK